MHYRHTVEYLAQAYREMLPDVFRDYSEIGRESVQVVIWLVGLSSAVFALLISNMDRITFIGADTLRIILLLLGTVIVVGVAQRLVHHWAERLQHIINWSLTHYISSYNSDQILPAQLSEDWTEAEIVQRFESEFGLNYQFLIEYEVSLESCREAYKSQYERWEGFDKEGLERFGQVVSAHLGRPKDKEDKILLLQESVDEELEATRRTARTCNLMHRTADILFVICGLVFSVTVALILVSVIDIGGIAES